MAAVKSYEELEVWKYAMQLAEDVYRLTESFPKKEFYRLTNQLCRAAISVPSNIAEGSMRHTTKDYVRFLSIAQGSLAEVETQLHLSKRLGYGKIEDVQVVLSLAHRVGKMLNGLVYSLQQKMIRDLNTSHQPPTTAHP